MSEQTKPKPTGFRAVWNHLKSWPEFYIGVPVAIIGMILLVHFAHHLLQRKPLDEGYDFVGLGFRFFTCILLILVVSGAKQAQLLGAWLTKEEQLLLQKTHWQEGVFQKVKWIVALVVFAYILIH